MLARFSVPGARMTTPLDPVIADIIPRLPLRDPDTMTPQSARDALRALAASRAAVPPPPVESVGDIQMKGAAGPLAARVYRVSQETSPTVVFFHGGGWVAGDLETHDRQARLLAVEAGAVVVSVDYRRPPETRFPGAFEDGFAAARDVIARIAEFGGDGTRVGVAGDSAGGNLAAATAIACRDAGIDLAAQLLVYPVTDVAGGFADAKENARLSVACRKC
jgi:acetyl esterase